MQGPMRNQLNQNLSEMVLVCGRSEEARCGAKFVGLVPCISRVLSECSIKSVNLFYAEESFSSLPG